MKINILVHGNSEGFNSDFMQYLNNHLKAHKRDCYGFDFDYIVKQKEPSLGQKKELSQLLKIIKDFKQQGYKEINLIGKSLGGVICLNEEIVKDPNVKNIFILGFPLVLGFPSDLSILKTKPIIPNPNAVEEYVKVFNQIGNNIDKIKIIQGTNDLSCPAELLSTLFNKCKKSPQIFLIENASHSFKPITEDTTLEANLDKIVNIIDLNS